MKRIVCTSQPIPTDPRAMLVVLGPQHQNVQERYIIERKGTGHLYIPDHVALPPDMLTWINKMEDVLDCYIYASLEKFSQLKPSLKNGGVPNA